MDYMRVVRLVVSLGVAQLAGIIGSVFTAPNIQGWYAGLAKPWFNPPNWVFAPAWTTLFILMGLALFLVWEKGRDNIRGRPGQVFGVQLVLNVLWSVLFFGLQSPGLALIEIVILWVAIAFNIVVFWRVRKASGYLLLPYIAWVSFAAVLNLWVFLLN